MRDLILEGMMKVKGGFTYIITSKRHTVLNVGVTSHLKSRIERHKTHFFKGSFSDRYNVEKLVYFETHETIENAIIREKQIKKWRREKKIALINSINPEWKDLSLDLID